MTDKIVVVTGADKGFGFELTRELCSLFENIYITAKDSDAGRKAIETLASIGYKVNFCELDVENEEDIKEFAEYLSEKHGGVDILINNAGIGFRYSQDIPYDVRADRAIAINYYGTLKVCKHLFPLLRSHARVVNISSRSALIDLISDDIMRARILNPNASIEDVSKMMDSYLGEIHSGVITLLGYPPDPYTMSKLGVTAITRIQQHIFDEEKPQQDIIVNACCPGLAQIVVNTPEIGQVSLEKGIETAIYLATLPDGTEIPRGELVAEKRIMKWWTMDTML